MADITGAGETCPSTGESGARTNWVMDEMAKGYHYARMKEVKGCKKLYYKNFYN